MLKPFECSVHPTFAQDHFNFCCWANVETQAAQAQYQSTVESDKDLYGNTTDLCKMVENNCFVDKVNLACFFLN